MTEGTMGRIPGLLAPDRTATAARQRSHAKALAILDEHYQTGRPFALYFRTFSVKELVGDDGQGYGTASLQNSLLEALGQAGFALVMVQDPSEKLDVLSYPEGSELHPFAADTPAIRLANDRWTEGVAELILRAELVISELLDASGGGARELEICKEIGRADRTVVVLRETFGDHPFSHLDDDEVIRSLFRVVHLDELDLKELLRTFVWHDLVDRLRAIAALPDAERLALIATGKMDTQIPISFAGVAEGFERSAQTYRRAGHHLGAVLAYTTASRVARRAGHPARAVDYALAAAWDCERGVGHERTAATLALAEELMAQAEASAMDAAELRDARTKLAVHRASLMLETGREEEGRGLLLDALNAARGVDDHLSASRLLERLTREAWERRSPVEAMNRAQETLREARAAGDKVAIATGLTLVGQCFSHLREPKLAADSFNEALALFKGASPPEIAWETFIFFGQLAQAWKMVSPRPFFEAALAIAQTLGLKAEENQTKRVLASIPADGQTAPSGPRAG